MKTTKDTPPLFVTKEEALSDQFVAQISLLNNTANDELIDVIPKSVSLTGQEIPVDTFLKFDDIPTSWWW